MARAMNLRRSDFGAECPNSNFQRLRSSSWPRSGKRAISASRTASSRSRRDIGLRRASLFIGLRDSRTTNSIGSNAVDLLREQGKFQLLAHGTREESSDRVLLPLRLIRQDVQCRAFWALKQSQDPILLGP